MKKILSILLAMTFIFSTFALTGCGKKKNLKLGLGIVSSASATDATEDKNGEGKATLTAATVLVNKKGTIVSVALDCADNKVAYTAEGKAITASEFKTKYELGDAYGMKSEWGSKVGEWYEQADAFASVVVGKTVNEVKALLAADGKGTDEVIKAGCTMTITEFVNAVVKAVDNAVATDATTKNTLKLGVTTSQTVTDATEDKNGSNELNTTFFAVAVNSKGKVVASSTDCVQVKFTFDQNGASTYDATKAVSSKKELGDAYGMKSEWGSKIGEWYEQAAAFDATCQGKTLSEIEALVLDTGKGNDELVKAGCTIIVSDFVKAAAKALK